MPCRRDEDLRRPGVRLLRLRELEGDDGLLLGEVPDPHTRREVAINGLDAELVIPICEDEPILTGELDRLLLAERSLIAADLLVVDELGDDHVVALDVGDGVLLGEAARLLAEVFVLPRDSVGRIAMLINVVVYSIGLFFFEQNIVVYSVIFGAVTYLTLDRMHLQNVTVTMLIITKSQDMEQLVFQYVGRGVTKWVGSGAYSKEPSDILLTVVSKKEAFALRKILKVYDPNVFVIMSEDTSVLGNFRKRLWA